MTEVSELGAGGVVVVSEVGIIGQGVTKSPYYTPVEQYAVKSDNVVLSSSLTKIRQEILKGDDNYKKLPLKSVRAIHEELYGEKRYRKQCGCKKECQPTCGCVEAHVACTNCCGCAGKCANISNCARNFAG